MSCPFSGLVYVHGIFQSFQKSLFFWNLCLKVYWIKVCPCIFSNCYRILHYLEIWIEYEFALLIFLSQDKICWLQYSWRDLGGSRMSSAKSTKDRTESRWRTFSADLKLKVKCWLPDFFHLNLYCLNEKFCWVNLLQWIAVSRRTGKNARTPPSSATHHKRTWQRISHCKTFENPVIAKLFKCVALPMEIVCGVLSSVKNTLKKVDMESAEELQAAISQMHATLQHTRQRIIQEQQVLNLVSPSAIMQYMLCSLTIFH